MNGNDDRPGGSATRVAPPPLPGYLGEPGSPPPLPPSRRGASDSGSDPSPPHRPRRARIAVEEDLIGTWFPRIGVVALVVGAAFGYKLAVDRGILDPLGRVALGLATGVAMLFIGERTRRRGWTRYAQAVSGGAIGLLTLVVWAAYRLYGLVGTPQAFAMLATITALGALLAIVHDSEALAVLATITGFLVPVVVGADASRSALSGYTLVLDVGVVALASFRRWRTLPWLASAGSWILFGLTVDLVSVRTAVAYATEIFALFAAAPLVIAVVDRGRSHDTDLALAGVNSIAYYTTVMALLGNDRFEMQAAFTASIGMVFAALAFASRTAGRRTLALVEAIVGFVLVTIAVPMGVEGISVGFVWTIEAVILLLGGSTYNSPEVRGVGAGQLGLALVDTIAYNFVFGMEYQPSHIFLSFASLALVVQIAALYTVVLVTRSPAERALRTAAWIGASLLTLTWLSWEAHARLLPQLDQTAGRNALSFWYSAIWGMYATALMTIGILKRLRGARTLALVIFGVTISKMIVNDLWLLPTALRTVAFIGLGVVLLACSLLYHRFRDVISGTTNERTNEAGAMQQAAV